MPRLKEVFRNNIPVVGWVFMAIWTAMLLLFTRLFVRDGGFHQFHPMIEIGIMALFWLFGAAGCFFVFGMPRTRLVVEGDSIIVSEHWLWRSRAERFALDQLSKPVIEEGKDSEGDPYFRCRVTTPSGRAIVVAEHNQKSVVEAARDRLLAVLP